MSETRFLKLGGHYYAADAVTHIDVVGGAVRLRGHGFNVELTGEDADAVLAWAEGCCCDCAAEARKAKEAEKSVTEKSNG